MLFFHMSLCSCYHSLFIKQLNLITVRIDNECHKPIIVFVINRHIFCFKFIYYFLDIIYSDCNMTIGITVFILRLAPVVCQLKYAAVGFCVVAQERQSVLVLWAIPLTQQAHIQHFCVKFDAALQIANSNHSM